MKILIVDDNGEDRKLLKYYLDQFKSVIFEAENGAEGLETAVRESPDLIISDALMPGVDGFQFLRNVRKSETLFDTPFVFYSAVYIGSREEELALSLGADAFIVKPKEPEEFLSALKAVLQGLGKRKRSVAKVTMKNEEEYLREYSQVVASKLEEKYHILLRCNADLQQSEEMYRNIIESLYDVYFRTDSNGIITMVSPSILSRFGYTSGELVGRHISDLHHNFANRETLFRKIKEDRFVNDFEVQLIAKDGRVRDVSVSARLISAQYSRSMAMEGIIRDVTERKSLENRLRHAQKMEALGTLTSGITHDFNNILTAIVGHTTVLKMKLGDDNALSDHVENILAATERAASMTQSLLAFSRKQPMTLKPINLNLIVHDMRKILTKLLREDIELKITTGGDRLTVLADPGQLDQVLMNLAVNARDAMPQGGMVVLTTEVTELDEEFMGTYGYGKPGWYAVLSFYDTGSGMSRETQQRIFEPFFTTKEAGKGTGLGLANAYGIVKQHNGYINCYSEPEKGTTFKIYLPLVKGEAERLTESPQAAPIGGTETVLVVEDDEIVREFVSGFLGEFGYKVITAADGEDALVKFREHGDSIQLLVVDIILPKRLGLDVYKEISRTAPGIRTIFTSGYPAEVFQNQEVFAKGSTFISKPISPNVLLRKVREVLDAPSNPP